MSPIALRNSFNPLYHFGRRPPRKRHEQDPPRVSAVHDQMCDPVSQRVRLTGTGTRNDQERATQGAIPIRNSMLYRTALLSIEGIEMDGC